MRRKKEEKKKKKDQYAEKKWVFSFDSKEESKDECLTKRGREQASDYFYQLLLLLS